jgi:hypothetical protein
MKNIIGIPLLQGLLDWIRSIENFVKLFKGPSGGFNKKEVYDNHLDEIPEDEKQIIPICDTTELKRLVMPKSKEDENIKVSTYFPIAVAKLTVER